MLFLMCRYNDESNLSADTKCNVCINLDLFTRHAREKKEKKEYNFFTFFSNWIY